MSLSLSRYELPRMLSVMAWWRMRSKTAVAMTRSPKTSPQLPKLWLLDTPAQACAGALTPPLGPSPAGARWIVLRAARS